MQLYYKVFSSTRHGFLGAGVVSQPLSHVWAAVSDPTLWPLYHKPIQTARLHQRVTNNINLGERRDRGSPLGRLGAQGRSSGVSGYGMMGVGGPSAICPCTCQLSASLPLQCTWCATPPCAH